MKKGVEAKLRAALDAPAPPGKEDFLSKFSFPRTSDGAFWRSQAGYIRKRIWLVSVLSFLFLTLLTAQKPLFAETFWPISALIPLVTLLSVSELARSESFRMTELEMSCRHSVCEVTLARMGILALLNLLLLAGLALFLSQNGEWSFMRVGLYLLVPFLLTVTGCLFVQNRAGVRESPFLCGGIAVFVSCLGSVLSFQYPGLFLEGYLPVWTAVLLFLCLGVIREGMRLLKRKEEFA